MEARSLHKTHREPTPAEIHARRTVGVGKQLMGRIGKPVTLKSTEQELREYMQHRRFKGYGHATALLSKSHNK